MPSPCCIHAALRWDWALGGTETLLQRSRDTLSYLSFQRRPTLFAVAFVVTFFTLVAVILGPLLFKERSENAIWYLLHIIGGTVVLFLGPFQFIGALRNRYLRYHRAAGYVYAVASVAAIAGYVGLPKNELFFTSQLVALSLWIACVAFAIRAIRSGNVLSHQHNMARSFVFASYFLTARLVDRYGMGLFIPLADDESIRLAHSDWVAWLIPLIIVEAYFAYKWQAVSRSKKRVDSAA